MAFSGRKFIRAAAALASIAALTLSAACGSGSDTKSAGSDSSDITQQTVTPGKLTIATGLRTVGHERQARIRQGI